MIREGTKTGFFARKWSSCNFLRNRNLQFCDFWKFSSLIAKIKNAIFWRKICPFWFRFRVSSPDFLLTWSLLFWIHYSTANMNYFLQPPSSWKSPNFFLLISLTCILYYTKSWWNQIRIFWAKNGFRSFMAHMKARDSKPPLTKF